MVECDTTWADCNGFPEDGCEVNLAADELNCGECGFTCTIDGGMGVCSEGLCGEGLCGEGLADCNFDREDGCEVDLRSDALNCGGCGNDCGCCAEGEGTR